MDYKKTNAPMTTVTRDVDKIGDVTGNVYEALSVVAKRADQVGLEIKDELNSKLEEFASSSDNLEEIFENREQIEISKFYERLPKPTALAMEEFISDATYYRNPAKDAQEED
jgi:DNA-directed RNA polymerase subunit K/omega